MPTRAAELDQPAVNHVRHDETRFVIVPSELANDADHVSQLHVSTDTFHGCPPADVAYNKFRA
jgi:hypothetical protein